MRVEAECYLLKRKNPDLLVESHTISPEQPKTIKFLEPKIGVAIFCKIENGQGYISIEGKKERVEAVLYENDDDSGIRIDMNSPIGIKGEQALSILPKRKPRKEVFLFIDLLAGEIDDFLDTLDLDKSPNSRLNPRPLVRV